MLLNPNRKLWLFMYLVLFCIALQQLQMLRLTRGTLISGFSPVNQPDFVTIYEKKLTNAKALLPPKSTIGYIQDSGISTTQGHLFLSQYAMAPHLLQEKSFPDTVLANFPISGTLQHPSNPLYAERDNWLVLKDFKNGFLLLKRK